MLTKDQKQFLCEELSFAQLTTVLLDLYYALPCSGSSLVAKELGIKADMVSAELNRRIYFVEV